MCFPPHGIMACKGVQKLQGKGDLIGKWDTDVVGKQRTCG